jgi:hypothetical protein
MASKRTERGLSLAPLSLEEALRGSMQGKPPEPVPRNKNPKRAATKRRLTKKRQAEHA